jgi:hypothetical protein
MSVQLDQVIAGLERGPDGQLELARPPADPRFAVPYGGLYWQIEEAGDLRAPARSGTPRSTCPPTRWATVLCMCTGWPARTVRTFWFWNARSRCRRGWGRNRARGGGDGGVRATRRPPRLHGRPGPLPRLLALALSAAGWVQLSVGSAHCGDLGARIAALREGRAERMGGDWPVELRPVATEIDDLLAARDAETERARARAADLAHGLKTPLQALMGEAGRLRRSGATRRPTGSRKPPAPCAARSTANWPARAPRPARGCACRSGARRRPADRGPAADPGRGAAGLAAGYPAGLSVALDEADLAEAMGALAENAARHARSKVALSARAAKGGPASDDHR